MASTAPLVSVWTLDFSSGKWEAKEESARAVSKLQVERNGRRVND
jgi:hypothetical protein